MLALTLLVHLLASAEPREALPAGSPWETRAFMEAAPEDVARVARSWKRRDRERTSFLFREEHHRLDDAGRLTSTWRRTFVIWSDDAIQEIGPVGASWASWHQERPRIRARVVTPSGEVHLLDPATLSEAPVETRRGVVTDRRELRAPLPALQPGSVVEIETVVSDREPLLAGGTVDWSRLGRGAARAIVRLEGPEQKPLRWVLQGVEAAPVEERRAGRRVLTWTFAPEAWEDWEEEASEPGVPEVVAPGPLLAFGSGTSWGEVAEAYRALAEPRLDAAALSALAREVAGDVRTREEATDRILGWMRGRLRYTALALGKHAIVPARPEEVLSRGYGDCKDLSLLFVGLMRALGFSAHLALVNASGPDLAPSLPGLGAFNHAIVRVDGRAPLWVDPAFPWTRPGELHGALYGRHVLPVRRGQQGLERIPVAAPEAFRVEIERELLLQGVDVVVAKERRRVFGAMAAELRSSRGERSAEDRMESDRLEAIARLEAKEVYVTIAELGDGTLEQALEAEGSKLCDFEEDHVARARLEPRLLACVPYTLLRGEERRRPLLVERPCAGTMRQEIRVRPGFRLRDPLPAPLKVESGGFRYEEKVEESGPGKVVAVASLRLPAGVLEPSQVLAIRSALSKIDRKGPWITFERTSRALLDAGRGREAVEELERVAKATGEAGDLAWLSFGLKELGLNDAAREVARRSAEMSTEFFPTSALSKSLASDAAGRYLERGCDHTGAVAAQRRAVRDAHPESPAMANLGWFLLHGEGCVLLGPGSAPEEGVSLIERSVKGNASDWEDELMIGLLALGRDRDAIALARASKSKEPWRNGGLLAALARAEGMPAAALEARSLDPKARAGAVWWGAYRLAIRRDYRLAAELVEAGSHGADGMASLRMVAGHLRATAAVAAAPDGSPLRAAMELVASPLGRSPLSGSPGSPTALERVQGWSARSYESDGVPAQVAAELVVGRWDAEWRDEGGGLGSLKSRSFPGFGVRLGRVGGGWQVLAYAGDVPVVAWRALQAYEAGELANARTMVGWVRELASNTNGGDEDDPARLLEVLDGAGADGRVVAAVFGASSAPALARPALEAELARSRTGEPSRVVRLALVDALLGTGEAGRAFALANGLLDERPGSAAARERWIRAACALGRRTEVAKVLAEASTIGRPAAPLRRFARAAFEGGLRAEVIPALERVAASQGVIADDYNQLAWARLFAPRLAPTVIAEAQRAAEESRPPGRAAVLHTLATVLAAAGEPVQAHRVLRESAKIRGELGASDHLVLGLIAEAYGLRDAAIASYRKVVPEPGDPMDSTPELARMRLEALGAAAGGR